MNRRNWLAAIGVMVAGWMMPHRQKSKHLRFVFTTDSVDFSGHLAGSVNRYEWNGYLPKTLRVLEIRITRLPPPPLGTLPLPMKFDNLGYPARQYNPFYRWKVEVDCERLTPEESSRIVEAYTCTLAEHWVSKYVVVRPTPENVQKYRIRHLRVEAFILRDFCMVFPSKLKERGC